MDESIRRKRAQTRSQMERLDRSLRGDDALMTEDRVRIIQMDPMALVGSLKEGHVSALQVLEAFQSKGLELTKEINCITEFIPEAEVWAKECDKIPAEERGPLHGVPVSIKDNINVQGMDSTLGLAKHLFNPASSHAVIVEVLRSKGAVPFCKTNIPQTLLSFCCSNPVFGETQNPHDHTRTPGGSSGGEAALIAGGGSVLGIGSDLAGSARVPASFSGCVGIKPTLKRLSMMGCLKSLEGMVGNSSTLGIMGRDSSIVAACLRVLVDSEEMHDLDLLVVPIPWRETKFSGAPNKLVFGYFDDLDVFPTAPGVKRAVHMAKNALLKAGHDVVHFPIKDSFSISDDVYSVLSADGGREISRHIKNEHIDESLARGMKITTTPEYLKPLRKFLLGLKSPLAARSIQSSCSKSHGLWKLLYRRDKKILETSQLLKEKGIDLLLSPVFAIPAPQPFVPASIQAACTYSVLFNFLDFPSGCVPVTHENEVDQRLLEDYPETDLLYRLAKQATRGASGLPIGVLISGVCWEEELVLRGMIALEQALKLNKLNV